MFSQKIMSLKYDTDLQGFRAAMLARPKTSRMLVNGTEIFPGSSVLIGPNDKVDIFNAAGGTLIEYTFHIAREFPQEPPRGEGAGNEEPQQTLESEDVSQTLACD